MVDIFTRFYTFLFTLARDPVPNLPEDETEERIPCSSLTPSDAKNPTQQLTSDFLHVRDHAVLADVAMAEASDAIAAVLRTTRLVFQPRLRATIRELLAKWRSCHDEQRDLIWRSRELAGGAQAMATDFVQVCTPRLQDPTLPLSEKLVELRDYDQAIHRHTEELTQFENSLGELVKKVGSIADEWSKLGSQFRKGKAIVVSTKFEEVLLKVGHLSESLSARDNTVADVLHLLSPRFFSTVIDSSPTMQIEDATWGSGSHGLIFELSLMAYLSLAIHHDIQHVVHQIEASTWEGSSQAIVDAVHPIEVAYKPLIESLRQYQVVVVNH
ncbi:hypothetical protein EIP91_005967 [Steccherinum ochraceum]|uniref:Uncharacterized protein n=1 Tax=Steccherinum ochraceum TaxID=92696 RepID=A0A4R0REU5_9APHY|nr:hypothetical protein EIP91_005967 [Steccherinum ochraceum]